VGCILGCIPRVGNFVGLHELFLIEKSVEIAAYYWAEGGEFCWAA
jgi:hypothetical protein